MSAIREFIRQRKSEIMRQLTELKDELGELEAAESALSTVKYGHVSKPQEGRPPSDQGNIADEKVVGPRAVPDSVPKPTIKEMVLEILAVRPKGATAQEIVKFIADRFGQQIERSSLSPQLSRLKHEGRVVLSGRVWSLPSAEEASTEAEPEAPPVSAGGANGELEN